MRSVPKAMNWWVALALAVGLCQTIDALPAIADPAVAGNDAVGQSFHDCGSYCPEMVILPPGRFTIGSPIDEIGRGSDENPQKGVMIAYAFAVGEVPGHTCRVCSLCRSYRTEAQSVRAFRWKVVPCPGRRVLEQRVASNRPASCRLRELG